MPGPALSYGPAHYSPEVAREYVELTFVGNCVLYATACLLVYEWVTSLDDEIERVWSLKWRLPKILFMLNRYAIRILLVFLWIIADFPGTSAEFCRVYAYWEMIPLRLAILAAQALIVIRVWAIYNNSRSMFWFLAILYMLEVAIVAACITVATADTQGVAQPVPLSCGLNSMSGYLLKDYASGTWIAPVCFEFIMVIVTLAKIFPRWKWGRGGGLMGSGGNTTLDVLARDSLIYFGFIFTFSLTNAVLYELSFSTDYHSILLGPTSAISCIAVSRMMINMRSLPSSLPNPTSTGAAYARADLSFAEYGSHSYEDSPDTARGAYFVGALAVGASGSGYFGLPPATPRSADGHIMGPGSARTSGDATRIGDAGSDMKMGSIIEMEIMEPR
ncbi:hypothetical protein DFH07DRAFT_1056634 [Mycena maculata]|uniref:DUF6533 domain-containing protein n=1 Tax=Mycena maculata TaxID=230809 RepID=A0AAD7K4L7_9AGAR|nr:hypothetical protein DFH07DRAFT_1056634 [Mycena maculata]